MRELIIDKILNYWHPAFVDIFDITIDELYNLSDADLLKLYNTMFEIGG